MQIRRILNIGRIVPFSGTAIEDKMLSDVILDGDRLV
jgi:hypothetical protein